MNTRVRGIRGATTVEQDSEADIDRAVFALLTELFERNDLHNEDLVSIILTATDDLHATFPSASARGFGVGDVPLLLAAGETQIFHLSHLFRNRERTLTHAPEFTMLEWYRANEPYAVVIEDPLALVRL